MDDSALFRRSGDAASTVTAGEVVILNFADDTYYGLNGVGARAWELLENGASIDALCAALGPLVEVDVAVLRVDLRALMAELVERKLVHAILEPAAGG